MRKESIVSVAVVAARDGGPNLITAQGTWIRETFRRALGGEEDPVHRTRSGLQYNPIAIAFVGTILLLKNRLEMADVRVLLDAAGTGNPAAAQGFAAGLLADIDERLPPALLRCAFRACIHPEQRWDMPEEDYEVRLEARRMEVRAAIEAEVAWLEGKQNEPEWPVFDTLQADSRHHYSYTARRALRKQREVRPERYTDHQAAALWLGKAASIFDPAKRPWLRDVINQYSNWTAVANGAELEEDDDPDRTPYEWNQAYFNLLARCLSGQTIPQIDALALVMRLPGEAFLDVTTIFVRSVDDVYFNGTSLGDAEAAHIRAALSGRLMKSRQWDWQRRDLSDSITTHLAPAIATLVFNDYSTFVPAKCYLLPKGIERLDPFLPALEVMAENGPFLFMAMTLLNLLEVAPRPSHLSLICTAVKNWLAAHPDNREFWIGQAVGRRVCGLLEAILGAAPASLGANQPSRPVIDDFLGKLIRLGVPEAHRLEESIRKAR